MVYALKYQNKYAKFSSYLVMKLVDHPENANLYSRYSDAKKRQESRVYLNRQLIKPGQLEIVEIHFTCFGENSPQFPPSK